MYAPIYKRMSLPTGDFPYEHACVLCVSMGVYSPADKSTLRVRHNNMLQNAAPPGKCKLKIEYYPCLRRSLCLIA